MTDTTPLSDETIAVTVPVTIVATEGDQLQTVRATTIGVGDGSCHVRLGRRADAKLAGTLLLRVEAPHEPLLALARLVDRPSADGAVLDLIDEPGGADLSWKAWVEALREERAPRPVRPRVRRIFTRSHGSPSAPLARR